MMLQSKSSFINAQIGFVHIIHINHFSQQKIQ